MKIKEIFESIKDDQRYYHKDDNQFIKIDMIKDSDDLTFYLDSIINAIWDYLYHAELYLVESYDDSRYMTINNDSLEKLIKDKIELKRLTKSGKFLKRFKKIIESEYKIITRENYYKFRIWDNSNTSKFKIEESLIQKLNVIINQPIKFLSDNSYIDVSNEDYKAGEFKESFGSCWWSDYDSGRLHFLDSGGFGIRHFIGDSIKSLNPNGRIWGYFNEFKGCDYLAIFNLYDDSFNNIESFINFIKPSLESLGCENLSYKKIHLNSDGILYINGGKGYIIYRQDDSNIFESFNGIDIDSTYLFYDYQDDRCRCERCDNTYYQDDLIYIESIGESICEHCVNDDFTLCESCNDYFENDDIINTEDSSYYCESCIHDQNYYQCESCHGWFNMDDLIYIESEDSYYCQHDADRLFSYCDNCYTYHDSSDIQEVNVDCKELNYCQDCIENQGLILCDNCQVYTGWSHTAEIENQTLCDNCQDDLIQYESLYNRKFKA